jgi:hypothetical protein
VFPAAFGSEAHHDEIWASLPKSLLWSSCGTAIKLSRWMSWNVKARHHQQWFGELQLAFLVLGLFDGFYHTLTDLPFASSVVEKMILEGDGSWHVDGGDGDDEMPELAGLDEMPVPADAAPVERAVVKRPLDGAEVLCPKKKRNAQLCMKVTSRPITLRAMVALRLFSEPIEFAHHELMAIVKDPEAVEKWAYEMANKKYNKYLYNILQRLWDEDCLTELLFLDTYDYPEEADSSGDMDLAKIVFDLVRSLISIELGVMRYQSCRPPMLFVQTMDKDVDVRNRAVEWCKHAQETVYRVELLAQSVFSETWRGQVILTFAKSSLELRRRATRSCRRT